VEFQFGIWLYFLKRRSEATTINHQSSILTNPKKVRNSVMPAKAGIQNHLKILDSRLRGNDAKDGFKTFYEAINIEF